MHNQLTTPPSSIATSKSPDHSPNSSRRLKGRYQSPKPYERQLAPVDDDNSSSSDDELRAPPRIPSVIKNLSYSVKRAKSQLKRPFPNFSDLGDDSQEPERQEIFKNSLRFISIQIVTQAIIAQQAKREWQRVLALATAWELEADVQHATVVSTSSPAGCYRICLSDMERGADMEAKKKRYQHQVMAFCTADSQLDHAESLARNLCQLKNNAPADDNAMECKAPEYELGDRQASGS
ncbi:hypothetical protein F4604DRAFT_1939048 [Suillus subluteus]|nr:hypothetical protein F4604DRAFT_1939048 [Suillus subluteus]